MPGIYRSMGYLLPVCAAILFCAGAMIPATGSYFKNQYFPSDYRYSLNTSPVLVDCSLPGLAVTELAGADNAVMAPGATMNVSLMETDPHQNWMFAGAEGVQCMGNSLIEAYPVRHVFRLKANGSCTVRFALVDDRDGRAIAAFGFRLIAEPATSGLGWPAFSPDLMPSFAWPPLPKF